MVYNQNYHFRLKLRNNWNRLHLCIKNREYEAIETGHDSATRKRPIMLQQTMVTLQYYAMHVLHSTTLQLSDGKIAWYGVGLSSYYTPPCVSVCYQ